MEYVNLGKTGLKAGRIGIGTEHLNRCSQKIVTEEVSCALDLGYNCRGRVSCSEVRNLAGPTDRQ